MRLKIAAAAGAAWGFAEATLFFLVPDVLVSAIAVRRLRPALVAALAAALGAAAGGVVMLLLARADAALAETLLVAVPGVTADTVARAKAAFAADGLRAAFLAAWTGVPYKIFAVAAGEDGRTVGAFALATVALRLPRFLLAALAARGLAAVLPGRARRKYAALAAGWALFYAAYFALAG